jgi:glucose-1-phosphate cytidylyltransferase
MVFQPEVFRYLEGDQASLEAHALTRLAGERQLAAYRHDQFWQCMDTLRELRMLERMWQSGQAPWKLWS